MLTPVNPTIGLPGRRMSRKPQQKPIEAAESGARKRGDGARHVYETIRDEILELTLKPGEPLDETALSGRFSMSRSPVREALVRLSAAGLVKTLSNRSTIVAPLELAQVPRYIEALDFMQRVVTRLAAQNRTEADLPVMEEAAHLYDRRCTEGDPLAMSLANKAFHLAVAQAGRNPYLTECYSKLLDEGRRVLHLHFSRSRDSDDPLTLSPEHFKMIEAIRSGDEAEADRLAHAHTRVFHQRLQEIMRVSFIEDLVVQ